PHRNRFCQTRYTLPSTSHSTICSRHSSHSAANSRPNARMSRMPSSPFGVSQILDRNDLLLASGRHLLDGFHQRLVIVEMDRHRLALEQLQQPRAEAVAHGQGLDRLADVYRLFLLHADGTLAVLAGPVIGTRRRS